MIVLAITDIPRMTALFEQLARQQQGLTVVSEIHRGSEELETGGPELVIFQNHLAGLSADILLKHLTNKAGSRIPRFALISSPEAVDQETAARFAACIDPAQSDTELEQQLRTLLQLPAVVTDSTSRIAPQQQPEPSSQPETVEPDVPQHEAAAAEKEPDVPAPVTYQPYRSGRRIMSDFSRQLDTNADTLTPEPEQAPDLQPAAPREYQQHPELITDVDEASPWYRRPVTGLIVLTLLAVVGTTLYQHRSVPVPQQAASAPAAAPPVQQPLSSLPPTAMKAVSSTQQPSAPPKAVRPLRQLPNFIPREGHTPAYSSSHPGWEQYRGQTNEYRVFRAKSGVIKAIQVIDRSGAGIQESLYTTILQELAGGTEQQAISSALKEGYDIRRGTIAGLQLVEYRDAQGGRLRGLVISWP